MPFCKKCGKELSSSEAFCPSCGTKVDGLNFSDAVSSVKRETTQIADKVAQSVKSGEYKNSLLTAYGKLGAAKEAFWLTLGSIVLNLILMFTDMVKISLLIAETSGSFYKIMTELKDYGGDPEFLLPMMNISIIVTIAALVLTTLPILLNKPFNKKYLSLNYLSMIYNFLLYLFMIIAYSTSEAGDYIEIKFMAYLYLAETVAVIVITKKFAKKAKQSAYRIDAAPEVPGQ